MGNFSGSLRSNEIFTAVYNMIISQQVFADNIGKHQRLVDEARVDGGLYGDQKLYYATDALASAPWGNDAEATNLLAIHRPKAPKTQTIVLDTFRQIALTVDNYLSKRAWADEGSFSSFNSVMLGWIGETKKIYDGTTYNTYIGTTKSTVGNQSFNCVLPTTFTAEERAKKIGQTIADLLVAMGDYSRDYNDYGFLRSYNDSDVKVIWNAKYVNEVRKFDTPAIFHRDGLVDKFDKYVIPSKYFGDSIADVTSSTYADATVTTSKPVKVVSTTYTYEPISGNTVILHCKEECDLAVYDTTASKYILTHFFAGDKLPDKVAIKGTFTVYKKDYNGNLDAGTSTAINVKDKFYKLNDKIICKVFTKLPPYMSAFEVGTSFFNAKSLSENHYLTWGRNTIEYLLNYPIITITESAS